MATYVLVHGAGTSGWFWHLVVRELIIRGHEVVAPDLPCDDDSAGLGEYADAIVDAVGAEQIGQAPLVVVAQSMGGFTAPLLCDRLQVDLIVLLNAMVPRPGETPGEWWDNTGYHHARAEQDRLDGRDPDDIVALFVNGVPEDLARESALRAREQSGTPFQHPWPLTAWPDVPTRVLICQDDKFFPPEFLRRVTVDRLGVEPDVMEGGHCAALSHPADIADRVERYGADLALR